MKDWIDRAGMSCGAGFASGASCLNQGMHTLCWNNFGNNRMQKECWNNWIN